MAGKGLLNAPMGAYIRTGFGFGIGSLLATMIFVAFGMGLFIGGYIIVKKEQKKPKDERQIPLLVTGYIMMFSGSVIGLGLGFGTALTTLGGDL